MATTSKSAKNGTAKRRPVFAKTYFPVRTNFSVKLTRSFRRDDESEWETTEYLSPQDLLPAARLLGEAYEAIQARQDEAYRERQQAGEGSDDQF
jgi:hypothetical protein